jgi:hypothetical protein
MYSDNPPKGLRFIPNFASSFRERVLQALCFSAGDGGFRLSSEALSLERPFYRVGYEPNDGGGDRISLSVHE